MTVRALQKLPLNRRDARFTRIRRIVHDMDAADRSLALYGEELAVDDALADIVESMNTHSKRPRKG